MSPFIVEDACLEGANSSCFSNRVQCEQRISQRYSLLDTNLLTPIMPMHTSQSVTNSSQVTLTHPHIGFTPKVPTSINISSSPLDTSPTSKDFENQPEPINQKFRNIYEIMEATCLFKALMADMDRSLFMSLKMITVIFHFRT